MPSPAVTTSCWRRIGCGSNACRSRRTRQRSTWNSGCAAGNARGGAASIAPDAQRNRLAVPSRFEPRPIELHDEDADRRTQIQVVWTFAAKLQYYVINRLVLILSDIGKG